MSLKRNASVINPFSSTYWMLRGCIADVVERDRAASLRGCDKSVQVEKPR
jgi:hypothetical protein